MKLEVLKYKIENFDESIDSFSELCIALEASYQQLQAISDQLENSEKHYEHLIENMSDIVWMTDIEGTIIYINNTVYDLLGYEKKDMINKKLYEFMCPLHEYKVGSCKACVVSMNDIEFNKEEMWMVHRDGTTRKVLEVNSSHIYHNGKIVEIQGIGRDITSRIKIERSLKKKSKYMSFIHEISTSISQNLTLTNLDALLDHTCKNIVKTMNVDLCSIRLIEGDTLKLKGIYGRYKEVRCSDRIPLNPCEFQNILKIKQPFIFTKADAVDYSEEIKNVFTNDLIYKILIVPLIVNQITIGIITIALNDQYEEEHLPLYASLGNNLAFACEKSKLYQELKAYYLDIIMTLVAAMEAKDPYTQGHSMRVSEFSVKIARYMNLSKEDLEEIEVAGILHDVGKIGIKGHILTKPGRLTKEEYEEIKKHPAIGIKILERIDLPQNTKDAILYHHLRVDLQGYPSASNLKEQPLFARIVGAADALDAMTSYRTYKETMDPEQVVAEFIKMSGSQFCPQVVKAIVALLNSKEIIPLTSLET